MPIQLLVFLAELFYKGYGLSKSISQRSVQNQYHAANDKLSDKNAKAHKRAIELTISEADAMKALVTGFRQKRIADERSLIIVQSSLAKKKNKLTDLSRRLSNL